MITEVVVGVKSYKRQDVTLDIDVWFVHTCGPSESVEDFMRLLVLCTLHEYLLIFKFGNDQSKEV